MIGGAPTFHAGGTKLTPGKPDIRGNDAIRQAFVQQRGRDEKAIAAGSAGCFGCAGRSVRSVCTVYALGRVGQGAGVQMQGGWA